jgi:PadR family transcriptional regulator AphA
MSAKHIVLGMLADRPAYPYQLLDRLEGRAAPDWRINSGQLYRTIKQLAEAGLIERIDGSSPGGREEDDRHMFIVTARGVAEFERWQAKRRAEGTGAGTRRLRRPVLAKLMFAGPERRTETLEEIDAYERACNEELNKLAKEVDEIPEDGLRVRADSAILKLGLGLEAAHWETELAWCPVARETFDDLYEKDAIWPSTPSRRPPDQPAARLHSEGVRKELFGRIAKRSQPKSARRQP